MKPTILGKTVYFFCVLFAIFSKPTIAYEIGAFAEGEHGTGNLSKDDFGFVAFEKNHEIFTALALKCLAETNIGLPDIETKPLSCSTQKPDIKALETFIFADKKNMKYPPQIDAYKDLVEYVRWPDDPARFINHDEEAVGKFVALTKGGGCKKRKSNNGGTLSLQHDGIFCNSHYGKLQFLHAMASDDGAITPQPAKETRDRIDEWATFSYRVALGTIDTTENYCDYWRNNKDYPNLAPILYEEGLEKKLCRDRRGFIDLILFQPETTGWRISTIFNWKCKNPLSSKTCTESFDSDMTAKSALGSLLHLIQDSYSKSHTNRGGSGTQPEVILSRVESYRSYPDQDIDKHSSSDLWPSFMTPNDGQATLDPITASAQVIWLAHNRKSEDKIVNVFTEVFGEQGDGDAAASPGEEYKK